MNEATFIHVDHYFSSLFASHDAVLDAALAASSHGGLPEIQVSPPLGKLLHLLVRLQNASAVLEIGTLGGYSAIWIARALALGGSLITLESDAKHAEIARSNIQRAGLEGIVEIRLGRALDLLPSIEVEQLGPFDLVFIDADKPSNPEYFIWALRLTRPGSLIIVDNIVREGEVLNSLMQQIQIDPTNEY